MGPTREPAPVVVPQPKGDPVPAILEEAPLVVPDFPSFSPSAIAHLLKVYRSTVQYWLANNKLDSFPDNIGERYVLRAELIRFVREYLGRAVQ